MNCLMLSNSELEVTTSSAAETKQLGGLLGGLAYGGLTILLHGELGAGKTVVAQGVGQSLGIDRIKSPSFILVSEHEGRLPLAHADLYRLEEDGQAEELDFGLYIDEGFLLLVEWAERWRSAPPTDRLDLFLRRAETGTESRRIMIMAHGARASMLLSSLSGELKGICL